MVFFIIAGMAKFVKWLCKMHKVGINGAKNGIFL